MNSALLKNLFRVYVCFDPPDHTMSSPLPLFSRTVLVGVLHRMVRWKTPWMQVVIPTLRLIPRRPRRLLAENRRPRNQRPQHQSACILSCPCDASVLTVCHQVKVVPRHGSVRVIVNGSFQHHRTRGQLAQQDTTIPWYHSAPVPGVQPTDSRPQYIALPLNNPNFSCFNVASDRIECLLFHYLSLTH